MLGRNNLENFNQPQSINGRLLIQTLFLFNSKHIKHPLKNLSRKSHSVRKTKNSKIITELDIRSCPVTAHARPRGKCILDLLQNLGVFGRIVWKSLLNPVLKVKH